MSTSTTFERLGGQAKLADPAPTAALNTPGSTKVSSLLMQDTVTASTVSIAPSLSPGTLTGRVALFSNPYADNKEEALVVDASGQLTYLQRADNQTGWAQSPVTGGGSSPIKAAEVVIVVHPTDLSVWAIYTSPSIEDSPQALQLVPTAAPGVVAWQLVPNAIVGIPGLTLRMSRLFVYYDGRTPYITGVDPVGGGVVTITGVRGSVARFSWYGYKKPYAFTTVDDFVAGRASAFPMGTHPAAPIGYVRQGNQLVRFNLATGESPETIATDAARIVGIFWVANRSDLGCVYLDTAGNLVTWNLSVQGARTKVKVAGFGFVAATSWIDINMMLHVYGLDSTGTLKVLHQSSWDTFGGEPVWSRTKVVNSSDTVPMCVPLVANVAAFAVDAFPDYQPNELVKMEGATSPDETFSFYAQDIASARWSRDKVRLPSSQEPHLVTNYVSTVTILDQRGNPMPSLTVKVSAESLAEIQVDGASYLVGPAHSAQLPTNALGAITISLPADGLTPATVHVDAVGLAQGAVIDPAVAIQDYLAGNGTLSSQKGLFNATALTNAKVGGVPLVGPKYQNAIPGTVTSIKNTFKIASGQPVTANLYRGRGPAPNIHGFAFGRALCDSDQPASYREFAGPDDLEVHLAAIRSRPEYGGLWDDFVNWAGDVWQGIKDGVLEVSEVVFGAVVKVFIWIGEKLVELVGFVLDTVKAAVHVVEAVFSTIAVAAAKVVDWLKALFSFKDIWDTKTALQEGMKLMLSYGAATADHFGDVAHGWFAAQSSSARQQVDGLKTTYAQRAVGDAANQVPTVTDVSGQATNPAALARDPQSSWLLNQTLGGPALAAARNAMVQAPLSEPIQDAFTKLMTKLQTTGIDRDVERISGDPLTAASKVTDPRDPDGAAKASVPALLDTLVRNPAATGHGTEGAAQDLLDAILQLTDEMVTELLNLIKAVAEHISDVLDMPLDLGPINTLYKWIQTNNGIQDPEELTLGGLLFLIGAFAFTTTYKLLNGVDSAPFPGGHFPSIPAPTWHPAYDANVGAPDPGDMRRLQIAAGVFGIVGSVFSGMADMTPMVDWKVRPDQFNVLEMVVAGGTALFTTGLFGMVSACPPVIGMRWTAAGGAWSGNFAVQTLGTVLSFGTMMWVAVDPGSSKILRNTGKMLFGPIMATALGVGNLIATSVAVARQKADPDEPLNDYAAAQAILFPTPACLQFLRIGATWKSPDPDVVLVNLVRCAVVAGIDLLATATSASMLMIAAAISTPPVIPSQQLPDGTVGAEYGPQAIAASGGDKVFNSPRKNWTLKSALPAGLRLDPEEGTISGTPQTACKDFFFTVTCTDSFGPPQPSDISGRIYLTIKANE